MPSTGTGQSFVCGPGTTNGLLRLQTQIMRRRRHHCQQHHKIHGDRASPGCGHDGLRRLHLDITKDGGTTCQRNSVQPRKTGTDSVNRIFSVPGRGGIDALLRNALGKQLEAGSVDM